MKRIVSMMVVLMVTLMLFPVQAFASSYPNAYDVKFVAGNEVVKTVNKVTYLESLTAPESYKDVDTWYCKDLNMEVKNGETIYADDFGKNKDVVFEADSVLPESFKLIFALPNGKKVVKTLDPEDFYNSFEVPDVDNANIEWTANNIVLNGNDKITGQDLDMDYTWYEKNPVLNFEITSNPVYCDSFVVKFVTNFGVDTRVIDGWSWYQSIQIPEGTWYCDRIDETVTSGDYMSAQTLDLDYLWYSENPVLVFYAK